MKHLAQIISFNPHKNPQKKVFLAQSSQRRALGFWLVMLPMITEAGMSPPRQCDPATGEHRSAGQPPSPAGLCVSLALSLLPGDTQCWAVESRRNGRLCACPGERSLITKLQRVDRGIKAAQALQPRGSNFKSQQLMRSPCDMHWPCDPVYHETPLSLGFHLTGRRARGPRDDQVS